MKWNHHAVLVLLLVHSLGAWVTIPATAAPLILNESNHVSGSDWLGGGDIVADDNGEASGDLTFGRIQGNGGDWFELVVTESNVDFRGWQIEIFTEGVLDGTLVLSQNALWTQLQAGSIVTISEDQVENASYDPTSGDWSFNVRAVDGGTGTYITASSFSVNNNDWQIVIRDASGGPQFGPSGEGVADTGGISNREIFRLEENPSAHMQGNSLCYDDASSNSTFGLPNLWSNGEAVQDFGPLRTGGAPTSQCDESGLSSLAFDPDHLLEIELVMDPADYDEMRRQQRSLMDTFGGRCGDAPPTSPYTFFPAQVTIDGTTLDNVGVRKKGFFGSVSRVKPALKIDFSEFGGTENVYGLERMTLNNSQQDLSLMDQCLSYGLFEAAGLVASRCNFAHVTINGSSLGIYTHVESIKAPFLVKNYGDSSGNLYEGALSDFREHYIDTFEKKNNNDGSDLLAVQAALEIEDDAAALAQLATLVDLNLFLKFWTLEGLIGNWDGYSGNSNNFWLYVSPSSGLFEFIPWSLDDTYGRDNPFSGAPTDARTVFDTASITNRLWQMHEIRELYEASIKQQIDTIWNEDDLFAEIDRMEALISPIAGDLSVPIAETKSWIAGRADQVAADFASGPPTFSSALPAKNCLEIAGEITASFTSTYSDPIPAGGLPPGSTFQVQNYEFGAESGLFGVGAAFGASYDFGTDIITLRGVGAIDGSQGRILNIPMPAEDVAANTSAPIQVEDTLGSFLLALNFTTFNFIPIGTVVNTELELTQADLTPGGTVSGTFTSDLAAWVPHPAPEPGMGVSYGLGVLALSALARRRHRLSR